MRNRGILATLLTTLLLVPAGAAQAVEPRTEVRGTATVHVEGYPTTTEPWRSLSSGAFTYSTRNGRYTATAVMGGEVPAGRDVVITWALGHQHPHGCEAMVAFGELNPRIASDGTIRVTRRFDDPDMATYTCFYVALRTDDVETDWIAGPAGTYSTRS